VATADSLLEIQWHTQQMHRVASGKPVDRRRGALRSLATGLARDPINALRRVRA
jgi:hypothetical protein